MSKAKLRKIHTNIISNSNIINITLLRIHHQKLMKTKTNIVINHITIRNKRSMFIPSLKTINMSSSRILIPCTMKIIIPKNMTRTNKPRIITILRIILKQSIYLIILNQPIMTIRKNTGLNILKIIILDMHVIRSNRMTIRPPNTKSSIHIKKIIIINLSIISPIPQHHRPTTIMTISRQPQSLNPHISHINLKTITNSSSPISLTNKRNTRIIRLNSFIIRTSSNQTNITRTGSIRTSLNRRKITITRSINQMLTNNRPTKLISTNSRRTISRITINIGPRQIKRLH